MPTLIYYNDLLINSGNQPVPLFSESENSIRYGEKWATNKVVTLNGQITGCNYNTIVTAKSRLENVFNKDFQPFKIIQDGKTLYETEYGIVKELNFDTSPYIGILNYSVNIECYPRNLFSGYFGVIDPVNEWEFNETDNQLLNVTHRIAARGIQTSSGNSNAFDNAKNYVLSLTGSSSFINPYFTNYCTGASLCVDTFNEVINRFDSYYEIVENYTLDLYNGGGGYIRYTTEYNCNLNNGTASLGIQGEVKSCRNTDLATLRNKYQSFDVYSAAVKAYNEASNRLDLNPNYLSSGIQEDIFSKKIGFNVQFDNDFNPRTFFEYSTDIKVDDSDITTVGIKGTIKSRGDLQNKWALVQEYYQALNLYYLATQSYNEFFNGSPSYPLNPTQLNYSVTKNQFVGEIEVSTAYDNKTILPDEFKNLDYTISVVPAIRQIRSAPLVNLGSTSLCNLNYYTTDLGFNNRAQININGRAVGICTGNYNTTVSGIKNLGNYWLNYLYNNNRVFLTKNAISQKNNGKGLDFDFNFGWSFDALQPATVSPYSFVDTLYLGPSLFPTNIYLRPDGSSWYYRSDGGSFYIRP